MFEQVNLPESVKWAILVFAAGFFGFFGKYLGRVVLSLFHREKEAAPPSPGRPSPEREPSSGRVQEEKIFKKTAKAHAKAQKKLGK